MKIKIECVHIPCETEVAVVHSDNPDEQTKKLIHQLRFLTHDIMGYKNGQAHRLSLQDVFYIECVDEKTFLYLDREVYETQQRLYEWENRLAHTPFVRISKSVIFNTDKLQSVRPLLSGKMEALMTNGEKQIINRHYLPDFRKKFNS